MILIAKSSNQSFGAILKKTYYLLQKKLVLVYQGVTYKV
jgi:hypothetical protein